jgi:hypothetical protein
VEILMFIRTTLSSKSRGKMITNPDWLKPKEKPYFHQISLDCLEKLVDCIGRFNKGEQYGNFLILIVV